MSDMPIDDELEEMGDWQAFKDQEQSLKLDLIAVLLRHHAECSDDDNGPLVDMQQWTALIDLALTATIRVHGPERWRQMWAFALDSAEADPNWIAERMAASEGV